MNLRQYILLLLAGSALGGCNPEVEVYAPERELYAVYGVLNPRAESQYIRISKVFQTEGDAYVYAGANDLSAKGMHVTMKGDGKAWTASLVENVPKDDEGVFHPSHCIYRFDTKDADSLRGGYLYELEIRKPDEPDFLMRAWTLIPGVPDLTSPGGVIYSPLQEIYSYPTWDFDDESIIRFTHQGGKGFELRLHLDYFDGNEQKTARWGPTRIFLESKGCRANEERNEMCYEIKEGVVGLGLRTQLEQAQGPVGFYDTLRVSKSQDSLSQVVRFEVTAVDTFLTAMLHSNTSFGFGLNLLLDKPEITNISGGNVGIFGSINTTFRYINLGGCTKYSAGLSNYLPSNCN